MLNRVVDVVSEQPEHSALHHSKAASCLHQVTQEGLSHFAVYLCGAVLFCAGDPDIDAPPTPLIY